MHDNIISVYTSHVEEPWSEAEFTRLLHHLPQKLQDKVIAETEWEERYGNLSRKLLFLHGMDQYGVDLVDIFENIERMPSGKPYVVDAPNFNLANDGSAAICTIAEHSIVGTDIERMKPVNLNDYRDNMTFLEWREIYSDMIPLRRFYEFWAIKESVLKADGEIKNMNIKEIFIRPDVAFSNEKYWYIHPLDIDYYGYVAFVVLSNPYPEIHLQNVDLLKVF